MAGTPSWARRRDKDPFVSFRFAVKIGDKDVDLDEPVCGFSEASGLVIETEVETIREAGENTHEIQLAGRSKFPSRLVLKRGLAEAELWSWYRDVLRGKIQRKMVTLVLQNPLGEPKWQWVFEKACPVKWSGHEVRADCADGAFESSHWWHRAL